VGALLAKWESQEGGEANALTISKGGEEMGGIRMGYKGWGFSAKGLPRAPERGWVRVGILSAIEGPRRKN